MTDKEFEEKFRQIDKRLGDLEARVERVEQCLKAIGGWLRRVTEGLQWRAEPGRDGAPVEDICKDGGCA
jgi:hypothetical protein